MSLGPLTTGGALMRCCRLRLSNQLLTLAEHAASPVFTQQRLAATHQVARGLLSRLCQYQSMIQAVRSGGSPPTDRRGTVKNPSERTVTLPTGCTAP